MKKLLLCLLMLLVFGTVAQAAEKDSNSAYQQLTLIEKMRMPIVDEKEETKSTRVGSSYLTEKADDGRIAAESAARARRFAQFIDNPTPTTPTTIQTNSDLPNVAVLYINNSKSTYNNDVDMFVLPNLGKSLPADKYNLIDGGIYLERLNKVGITDLSTAERADILDAFKGDNIDYIIIMEIQPFIANNKITFFTIGKDITTAVPFKIIDAVNSRYLYNGKFTEKASDSTMVGLIGNKSVALKAMNNVNKQVSSVVETRLPLTKPVLLPANPSAKK